MSASELVGAVPGDDTPARLRLVAVEWRRIQVTMRFRPGPGPLPADVSLVLLRDHGPGPARRTDLMPPTRAWLDEGDLVARFNVMQGPDQLPMATGTWRLGAAARRGHAGSAGGASVEDPDGVADRQPDAVFLTPRGTYGVALHRGGGFDVRLEVSLVPAVSEEASISERLDGLAEAGIRLANQVARVTFVAATAAIRRVARRRRPAILFASSTRPALGGNLAAVHDRMVERGLAREVEILLSFKPDFRTPTSLRERLRTPWLFARPDVIVLDDYHRLAGALDDPRVRIVQLWHASGVVKTILYSRIGKPGGPDPWSRAYKNATHAIASSNDDVAHFAEAFGVPEDRVVATGIPRMDRFFNERAREAGQQAALAAFPAAQGRRVILFAPTFRGAGRTKSYDLGVLDYPALHAMCVEKNAVFIIRLHPRMRRPLGIPPELGDRLLDGSDVATDAPDILFATDLLITDYSSIIFEFATLGRPMLFFAPDLDEYRESVDFYEPYETLVPGKVVRTLPELVDAIRREDYEVERLAPFVARHLAHLDAQATDRVIDQLILPGLRRP